MLDSTEDREEAFFSPLCESFETEKKGTGEKKKIVRAGRCIDSALDNLACPSLSSSVLLSSVPVCPPDCSPLLYFTTVKINSNPPTPGARRRQATDSNVRFIGNARVLQVG